MPILIRKRLRSQRNQNRQLYTITAKIKAVQVRHQAKEMLQQDKRDVVEKTLPAATQMTKEAAIVKTRITNKMGINFRTMKRKTERLNKIRTSFRQ